MYLQRDKGKEAKLCLMHFTWSMKNAGSLDLTDMIQEICKVLDATSCSCEQRKLLLLFHIQGFGHTENLVQWEVEACKLPRLSLSSLCFSLSRNLGHL